MNFDQIFVPDSLREFFAGHPRIALAFSGGCDSAYLLYAAAACGVELGIYYVHSCFQPEFELEDARRLAAQFRAEMRVLEVDILADERVRANPADRCYHCKRRIFEAILCAAQADGYRCIMDGTNASDDASDRPGMRALKEMQVLSPLRMCGITKQQVRALSRDCGTTFIPAQSALARASKLRAPEYWLSDGLLPTDAGHGLLAGEWINAAKELIL